MLEILAGWGTWYLQVLISGVLFTCRGLFTIVRPWSFVILHMWSATAQSRSFAYVGPSVWNCPPQSLHMELHSLSPLQLRKRLKTFLFTGLATCLRTLLTFVKLYNHLITLRYLEPLALFFLSSDSV